MFIFNEKLPLIYMAIAALFAGAIILRVAKLYPGQPEPLILDFLAVLIALAFGYLARILATSAWRFPLIPCSSVMLFPHFWYIFCRGSKLK